MKHLHKLFMSQLLSIVLLLQFKIFEMITKKTFTNFASDFNLKPFWYCTLPYVVTNPYMQFEYDLCNEYDICCMESTVINNLSL